MNEDCLCLDAVIIITLVEYGENFLSKKQLAVARLINTPDLIRDIGTWNWIFKTSIECE